jgi:hypothetical protein
MFWIFATAFCVGVVWYVMRHRGERSHTKAEQERMYALLETVEREQKEEPFERFVLDIDHGPETFLIGEVVAGEFRISRENRVPRFRSRRYWLYLPGETLAEDFWSTFLPKGKFAVLIDRILDAPPTPKEEAKPEPVAEAETPPAVPPVAKEGTP